jgi:hypothetical protein
MKHISTSDKTASPGSTHRTPLGWVVGIVAGAFAVSFGVPAAALKALALDKPVIALRRVFGDRHGHWLGLAWSLDACWTDSRCWRRLSPFIHGPPTDLRLLKPHWSSRTGICCGSLAFSS